MEHIQLLLMSDQDSNVLKTNLKLVPTFGKEEQILPKNPGRPIAR